ncbi:MAG TPA: hypothetical protein VEZ14_03095 [Dehalococcoidia bacterium]|nr:hypothetical protein [Dehalococcoidia bacterium]
MGSAGSTDLSRPGARRRSRRLGALALAPLLVLLALFGAAKCYPAGTRVVVFMQGIYTTYDASGTQTSLVEAHRFDTLKAAFVDKGYSASALLDFSYAGGTVTSAGVWQPAPYTCDQTDRLPADNLAPLEQMLSDYRARHRNVHFTLVGHSLGGYLAFLEGAREAGRPPAAKLGVDVVVTFDAPIKGISADKKPIIDLLPCTKTYLAGADLVAQHLDPATPAVRQYQAAVMAQQGVRLATLGNSLDCLYNTAHCIGGTYADDSQTQFLPGEASISNDYKLAASPFASHDQILVDPNAVHDAVTFVGAP